MKLRILIIITTLLLPFVSNAVEINDYMNNRHCDQVLDKQFYKICYIPVIIEDANNTCNIAY